MIRIRLRENGPIVIESDGEGGTPDIFDWNGVPYVVTRTPIALCRCGGSAKKPFCDGSHRTNGFRGGDPAATPTPPDSES